MQSSNTSKHTRRIALAVIVGLTLVLGSAVIFTLRQAAYAPGSEQAGVPDSADADAGESWRSSSSDSAGDRYELGNLDERDRLPEEQDDRIFQEAPSSEVDLVALRREMPDNLYWQRAVPTEDPEELHARAKAAAERNELFGKVLSNTASVAEIQSFYADKLRQSNDYAAFVKRLLEKHKDQLSERDLGLFGLALELHTARAVEIPREEADALARRAKYQEKRAAWLTQSNR